MIPSVESPVPISQHVFQAAEIWLILQALEAIAPDLEAPPDIASDAKALQAARASLIKQGMMLTGAAGEANLTPEVVALVRPSAFPETVFVASVSDNAKQGKLARLVCFSWTPDATVINWVDESNIHHFEAYGSRDIVACMWNHLLHLCDLDVKEPGVAQASLSESDIQRHIEEMKQMVLLMATSGVQSRKPTERAIGWFVSNGYAWLMEKSKAGEELTPRMASQSDIAKTVSDLILEALP